MNYLKNRNCLSYQIYYYAKKSLFLFYIMTIYYLSLGLSYTDIAIISVVGTISTMISEIPTGMISDNWSRKKSLQIAEMLKIISIALKLYGGSLGILCFSSFMWGIADACQSGTDQALLYESFDDEREYEIFLSKLYSFTYIFSALSTIFATLLFSINSNLPLLISLCLSVISLISISCFIENPKKSPNIEKTLQGTNSEAIALIKTNRKLGNLIYLMCVCMVAVMFVNANTQPLLLDKGISLNRLGLLMFFYNLLMSFGARMQRNLKFTSAHYMIAVLIGLLVAFIGTSSFLSAVFLLGIYRILNGMIFPKIIVNLNQLLPSEIRATVMSFQSMATNILCTITDPLIGKGLDVKGISMFYTIFGIIYTIVVLLLYIHWKYSNQHCS